MTHMLKRFRSTGLLLALAATTAALVVACTDDDGGTTAPDGLNLTPGEGVTVQPARPTWDTEYFLEALYSRALRELGYNVQPFQELDNPIFYLSVAEGDVTYWASGWFPLHEQYEDVFSQGAEIAGTVSSGGALEGYLVDRAGADEFGITSLADFERPEVKAAYDWDGTGRANMVACPDGWGCNTTIGFHLDEFGLRDHIDEITADYSPAMADLIARYNSGEHVLFYTWTPNWTVGVLQPGEDVVWIGVPDAADPHGTPEADMTISDLTGAVSDPLLMGYPPNDIMVVANSEFLAANPAARTLFSVMGLELADIAAQNEKMNAGENTQADIERHVDEWIAANQATWDGWLQAAREAAN